MKKIKPDIKPDKVDRREATSQMEPLLLSESSPKRSFIQDLSLELASKTTGFRRSLPASMLGSLAELVRSMNCYYSNLIEGHDTHPIDIERALKNDYSQDPKKRNLQLEAKAHIHVQSWIDAGGLKTRAFTCEGILEVHRRFYEELPDELRFVENPETKERIPVIPGELRTRDVKVGQHIAISPGAVARFLQKFVDTYGHLGKLESTAATAAAHHRLAWIHPFLDGNGRVVRLLSHATMLETLGTGALWSVARGLARTSVAYKGHLANCDLLRRNDLDGRGNLSQEALADFTQYFLETCLDQVNFMESLMQLDQLRARILLWAKEQIELEKLPQKSTNILEAILYRGEIPRSEIPSIVGAGERHARRIVQALTEMDVLRAESTRAPLRLAFPATLASRWMPGLFPDKK